VCWSNDFWKLGYCDGTVGLNLKKIQNIHTEAAWKHVHMTSLSGQEVKQISSGGKGRFHHLDIWHEDNVSDGVY